MSDDHEEAHEPKVDGTGTEYKVGHRRPPREWCFKPGCSGNPKGRPKGSRNPDTVVSHILNGKIPVRENGRVRRITKFEAMVEATLLKAIKGDSRSANTMIGLMAKMNQLAETETETTTLLPQDDAAIIADFLRRMGLPAGSDPIAKAET
jgi:Family of unknown function (DUF5681)